MQENMKKNAEFCQPFVNEHMDVTLRVDGQELEGNKIILCGSSPYFRAIFSDRWTKKDEKESCEIPDISPDIMSLVIEHTYMRPVLITEKNVSELLAAADRFLMQSLIDHCCTFMERNLSLQNCISACLLTEDFHSCAQFHRKVKLYLLQHFEEVRRVSEEFLKLSAEHLEEIISQDELDVTKEELVFEAIVHWIEYEPENRKKHLPMLLSKVRFGLMSTEFVNDVENNPLVLENEECEPIITSARTAIHNISMGNSDLIRLQTRPRLPSALLLAIGGWSTGRPTSKIEVYDTKVNSWFKLTQGERQPRAYHGTAFLDGFVYCIGGFDGNEYFNSVTKFNLITQTWHEVAPMNEHRCYVSVVILDGFLYAIGGFNGLQRLNTVERYDVNINQWTRLPSMHERRSDASATTLNGKIYICGGFTGAQCLFTAESYDPKTNQWSLIADMHTPRSGVGVATCGNYIYAVGGFDGISRLQSAEAYSPVTDSWRIISPMINQRSNFGIEVLNNKLFVAGGFKGSSTFSNVEFYDQEINEWIEACDMSISRSALSCCVISGLPVTQYVISRDLLQIQDEE